MLYTFTSVWNWLLTPHAADPEDLLGLPEAIEEQLSGSGHALCAAFNSLGTLLATGCKGGEVVIWDFQTRGPVRTYKGHR